jgi:hypothetical protein
MEFLKGTKGVSKNGNLNKFNFFYFKIVNIIKHIFKENNFPADKKFY